MLGVVVIAVAGCELNTYGHEGSSSSGSGTGTGTTVDGSTGITGDGTAATGATGTTETGSVPGTTGEPPPMCPLGAGNHLNSRGFDNPGSEETTNLEYGPGEQLTALYYTVSCVAGDSNDFGGGTPEVDDGATNVLYLAQYDPDLVHLRTQPLGGVGYTAGGGLTIDGAGNIYIVGYFTEEVGIPACIGAGCSIELKYPVKEGAELSAFIVAFDAGGKLLKSETMRATGAVRLFAIDAADDGEFVVAGTYWGAIEGSDECPVIPSGIDGAMVRKYGPDFTPMWTRCLAEPEPEVDPESHAQMFGVAIDPGGGVVAGGDFTGALIGEGVPGPIATGASADPGDAIVVGWDREGDYAWHRVCASEQHDLLREVVIGGDGRVVIAGAIGAGHRCSEAPGQPGSGFARGLLRRSIRRRARKRGSSTGCSSTRRWGS